jgi:hypothetical protein
VDGSKTFASLAAGANHTCGLARTGGTWCWGDGNAGQRGDGTVGYVTRPAVVAFRGEPTARSVRVTNVQDSTFTVSWVTDTPSKGLVRWGLGGSATPATEVQDVRGSASVSTIHYVTISGLSPSTPYRFDVVSDTTVDANGGVHYLISTGPLLAVSSPMPGRGKVFRSDGGNPDAVLVYLSITGSAGASAVVSDLVTSSDAGAWAIDLGGLRVAGLDGAYSSASATYAVIVAEAGGDGAVGATTTTSEVLAGSSSFNLGDQASEVLGAGWNLLALRVTPTRPLMASSACALANASAPGTVVEIVRWAAGAWESHRCGVPPNDFVMQSGAAYFVRATVPRTWMTWGQAVTVAAAQTLRPGWNLVGASASGVATTAPGACLSLNEVDSGSAVEVVRWINSGWEAHTCGNSPNSFAMSAGRGYFVRMLRTGTLFPVGSLVVTSAVRSSPHPAASTTIGSRSDPNLPAKVLAGKELP